MSVRRRERGDWSNEKVVSETTIIFEEVSLKNCKFQGKFNFSLEISPLHKNNISSGSH